MLFEGTGDGRLKKSLYKWEGICEDIWYVDLAASTKASEPDCHPLLIEQLNALLRLNGT